LEKVIYLISGLGADERIFGQIDFKDYETKHITWITPKPNEHISDYASRLTEQITTPKPILLGVSFGGIIAIEISKIIDYQQLILISSVKTKHDLPFYFRLIGFLKIHNIIPFTLLKRTNFLTYWFFSMSTSTEKELLKNILTDTDVNFLKWAINAILIWKNDQIPLYLKHIHGSNDKILPHFFIKNIDFIIKNGGHLMVYNKANDVIKLVL
jgi:pimeloyl-ACP methyl ester carboxylesterase